MSAANPYDDLVMDHIRNTRNYRVLDQAHRQATGTNPLCGDEITVFLQLEADTVADIAFQCTCCGISMASASMMTEQVRGMSVQDASRRVRAFHGILSGATGNAGRADGPTVCAMLETVSRYPARTRCAALPWITLADLLETIAGGRV